MQCKLETRLPDRGAWLYEAKLDGYRALAVKHGGKIAILSRRNNPLTADFPEIAAALEAARG